MAKSGKPMRRPLIRMLLDQGFTKKQIAESANCSLGYVYQVSWDYELEKKQMAETPKSLEDTGGKPVAFSDDWDPPTWKLLLIAVPAGLLVYSAIVFVFSLN